MSYINQFVSNVRSDGFLSASRGAACFLLEHDLAFLPAALARVRPRTHTATVDDLSFDVLGDWRPSGGIGKDFPRNGCHEPITSRIILNELQSSGGVFYDIGAATGYFTVLAAQTIPPTNIHVFEPANQSGVLKKT